MTDLKKTVENLTAPERKGMKVSTKWEVPSASLKRDAKDNVKFSGLDMLWVFDANPKTQGIKRAKGDVLERDNSNKNTQKTDKEVIPRSSFYPYKGKPKLAQAEFWIRGYNRQGTANKKHYGPWVHRALTFKVPAKPELEMSYDPTNGQVTTTYTTTHPDGARECHDTVISITVAGTKKKNNDAYTDLTRSFAYEVPNANILPIGGYKKVTAKAKNRGLAGASDEVTAKYYVCHPNKPVCGKPTISYATKGVLSTAAIRIPITAVGVVRSKTDVIRPQEVQLQRIKNTTTATDKAAVAQLSGWENVAVDNGTTNGLTDTWVNAVSEAGKYTWYRAIAKRDGYETYGVPVQAKCINVLAQSQTAGRASISLASGEDGVSIVATLSGKQANDDGYEVSWSEFEDAWNSTEQPETFTTANSSLIIRGLDEGVEYFARARAFDTASDDSIVYGQYSDTKSCTPITMPSTVVLSGTEVTPRGSDLVLSWTYDTDAPQKQWRLVDASGKVRYSGKGAACRYVITRAMYGSASSLTYHVEMTTGGGWAKSDAVTFTIADPPTCSITVGATLTAQPLSFTVASDKGDTVAVALTALGSSGTGLHGDAQQYDGDTVHAALYSPTWATSNNVRSATIELPSGLALLDGASYRLDVSANDVQTGLDSATASAVFEVDWTHKASQPTGTITVNSDDRAVTVTVAAPSDYATGDRFDLYRVTADGERRIAQAQPFGTAITDRRAPYSYNGQNLRYIAVTRTADGSVCISDDIEYTLVGSSLRFDWGDAYIELPYDISMSDTIENDAETRKHMDGTSEGYAESGYSRSAELSANIIRLGDAEQKELVRSMLQHPGSVFVRTPDGLAYSANVTPGRIGRSARGAVESIDVTAEEHALTEEDIPGANDIVQPAWGGGAVEAHNGVVYDSTGGFPMDDWMFVGYSGTTLYVCDPDSVVRDGDGEAMDDWEYDGEALYDDNGDEVEVTDEPTEG